MRYYSAASVMRELQANKDLSFEGGGTLGCPASPGSAHAKNCPGNPAVCAPCLNTECEQPVSVHRDYKKLVMLVFLFRVSGGGGIPEGDSALEQLIKRNYVDRSRLQFCR